ncbi:MAG TPA: DUF3788 family protein [Bacteroidota bacterium]|nr:DUF3788 family protein [Bacteroidota bacterium]
MDDRRLRRFHERRANTPRPDDADRPKLPFNDLKHPPTRPEIDLLLGVLPAIELKRFEHQLELLEPQVNWAMQWYENDAGWGYRASFKARVVCVLHFYKGYFTVTFSVPLDEEAAWRGRRENTEPILRAFEHGKLSPKTKWITVPLHLRADVEAVLPLLEMKLLDLKAKTSR